MHGRLGGQPAGGGGGGGGSGGSSGSGSGSLPAATQVDLQHERAAGGQADGHGAAQGRRQGSRPRVRRGGRRVVGGSSRPARTTIQAGEEDRQRGHRRPVAVQGLHQGRAQLEPRVAPRADPGHVVQARGGARGRPAAEDDERGGRQVRAKGAAGPGHSGCQAVTRIVCQGRGRKGRDVLARQRGGSRAQGAPAPVGRGLGGRVGRGGRGQEAAAGTGGQGAR